MLAKSFWHSRRWRSRRTRGFPPGNAASESGKTAADVLGSTARLTAESEALGDEVDRFLNRIKAA